MSPLITMNYQLITKEAMLHNAIEFNLQTCCYGEFSLIIAISLNLNTFLSILVTNRIKKDFCRHHDMKI